MYIFFIVGTAYKQLKVKRLWNAKTLENNYSLVEAMDGRTRQVQFIFSNVSHFHFSTGWRSVRWCDEKKYPFIQNRDDPILIEYLQYIWNSDVEDDVKYNIHFHIGIYFVPRFFFSFSPDVWYREGGRGWIYETFQ